MQFDQFQPGRIHHSAAQIVPTIFILLFLPIALGLCATIAAASRHVTYVMTCASLTETAELAARAPHDLAAALISGHAPDWLKLLPKAGPYQVYVTHD